MPKRRTFSLPVVVFWGCAAQKHSACACREGVGARVQAVAVCALQADASISRATCMPPTYVQRIAVDDPGWPLKHWVGVRSRGTGGRQCQHCQAGKHTRRHCMHTGMLLWVYRSVLLSLTPADRAAVVGLGWLASESARVGGTGCLRRIVVQIVVES